MPDYFLAPSLVALRNEINQRWPGRDKASDGWIGDAAHSARRSDHNPDWDAPGVRRGIVRAIDVDKDGISVEQLLDAVVRDHRVAYVIWNRRIASATDDGTPWDWEPYAGTNPHDKHVHISIKHTAAAETDTSRWLGTTPPPPPPTREDDEMTPQQAAQLAAIYNQTRANAGLMVSAIDNLTALMTRDQADDTEKDRVLEQIRADMAAVRAELERLPQDLA